MSCTSVHIVGSGSASHPQRNQSSVIIDSSDYMILIDVGCRTPQLMEPVTGRQFPDLILLTHKHYDHLCGLPMLAFLATFKGARSVWVAGEPDAISLAKELVSLAFKSAASQRSIKLEMTELKPGSTLTVGPFKVIAFEARHTVPALSYQVEAPSATIVISGDTQPTEAYRDAAEGSDVAVHEATLPSGMEDKARATGHSTVGQAVEQVSGAKIGVLYHLTPESEAEALRAVTAGARIIVPSEPLTIKIC